MLALAQAPSANAFYGPAPTPSTVGHYTSPQMNWQTYFQQHVRWTLESRPNLTASWSLSSDLQILTHGVTNGTKYTLVFKASCTCYYRLNVTLTGIQSTAAITNGFILTDLGRNNLTFSYADIASNLTLRIFPTGSLFSQAVFKWSLTSPVQIPQGTKYSIDPSTIGTSTSNAAVGLDRKLCFQNTLWWAFYTDGSNWVYASSTDGKTWVLGASSINSASSNAGTMMTVTCDGTYVYLSYPTPDICPNSGSARLCFRRGLTANTGIITWDSVQQVTSSNTRASSTLYGMALGSDGSYWLTWLDANLNPNVDKSSTRGGIWTEASGFPHALTSNNPSTSSSLILPLNNGKMLALYDTGGVGTTVRAQFWDGSNWGSEETATSTGLQTAATYSAASLGDVVYIIFLTSNDLRYVSRSATGIWSSEIVIASTFGVSFPNLSLSIDTVANPGTLYAFWDGIPTANQVYYSTLEVGSTAWTTATKWFLGSNVQADTAVSTITTAPPGGTDAYIGYLYEEGSGSPYNIRFNYIDLPLTPSTNPNQTPQGSPSGAGLASIYVPYVIRTQFGNVSLPDVNYTKLTGIPLPPGSFYIFTSLTAGFASLAFFILRGRELEQGAYAHRSSRSWEVNRVRSKPQKAERANRKPTRPEHHEYKLKREKKQRRFEDN